MAVRKTSSCAKKKYQIWDQEIKLKNDVVQDFHSIYDSHYITIKGFIEP